MNLYDLASKKVAILGMGIEGLALAEFLKDKNCTSVTLLDRKTKEEFYDQTIDELLIEPGYGCVFGEDYLSNLNQYDIIFRSPGIRYLMPELQKALHSGVILSSQINLFFDLCPCQIIGVTGTKGKGTTSSLIYEIMRKNDEMRMTNSEKPTKTYLAGNIGEPAVTLLPVLKEADTVILELSSFQLQDLHKSPHIGVILNVSSDHLDYHVDNEEYLSAKSNLVVHQTENDIVIANHDYPNSVDIAAKSTGMKYYFSGSSVKESSANVRKNNEGLWEVALKLSGSEEVICNEHDVQIFGKHNMENIAAASLVASLSGADTPSIKEAVRDFEGLPHRLEFVGKIDGVKIFNDSFSTNPEPAIAAIKAFNEPKMLILGGSTKGADFDMLAKEIVDSNTKAVALIGDESDHIKSALNGAYYNGVVIDTGYSLIDAIDGLMDISNAGDVLLFSPACASFDMFKNYKDRGEKFKAAIAALK